MLINKVLVSLLSLVSTVVVGTGIFYKTSKTKTSNENIETLQENHENVTNLEIKDIDEENYEIYYEEDKK